MRPMVTETMPFTSMVSCISILGPIIGEEGSVWQGAGSCREAVQNRGAEMAACKNHGGAR